MIELPWIEPIEAAAQFSGRLLDGKGAHPEAKYAFLGVHPERELRVADGKVNGETCDVLARLRNEFAPITSDQLPHPWTGGWLGYLGYEFTRYVEPTLKIAPAQTPDALFEWFATGIVFDYKAGKVTAYGTPENLEKIHKTWGQKHETGPLANAEWTPRTSQVEYEQNVRNVKQLIAAGDLFQANIATRFDTQKLDAVAVFKQMAARNPSPYMCYLPYNDHTIVSNSPEQLFATRDGKIFTRPIAGTRPRGNTALEDKVLAAELRSDEKERAEHMMLVDLLRNDVSKVSKPGTTQVTEWMSIERYSHVMHLVSQVTGELTGDVMDCVQAIFPGGTITGAPKHRACMRIAETEPVPRGPYTGSAGFINHRGDASFNIMIRTMTITNKSSVHAGAGIVMDSEPAKEWQESLQKASAFLNRPGGSADGSVEKFDSWKPSTTKRGLPMRVLLVDNYDSFVENLRDYCEMLGAITKVIRNDADWQQAVNEFAPTHIILSPGPGHPVDSGATFEIAKSDLQMPMLGVCLGHQAMALAAGGEIEIVPAVHGKTDVVSGHGPLFSGSIQVARYHSLVAKLPAGWTKTSELADGTLMAMQNGNRHGLQFHPESMGTPEGLAILAKFLHPTHFETIRVKNRSPVRLDLHEARAGQKITSNWDFPDGLVRVEFGKEQTFHPRPVSKPQEIRVAVSPRTVQSNDPLRQRKILEARAQDPVPRGFDDLIFLNEIGNVVECRYRNVVCMHDGTLYAPGPAAGALPGTSRARILEAWTGQVSEQLTPTQEGEWVAISVGGVFPIAEFNGPRKVGEFAKWCEAILC